MSTNLISQHMSFSTGAKATPPCAAGRPSGGSDVRHDVASFEHVGIIYLRLISKKAIVRATPSGKVTHHPHVQDVLELGLGT